MGLFDKMKEPVFLKESSKAEEQLEKLKALEPSLTPEGQAILRQDIKYLESGIVGEKNIAFELKNSHMPMYILHDIYLEDGDLSAQIDYLVVTKKLCFVIECKNLYGDIEINSAGDFIRTTDFNGKKKKEGIYSPLTQNQRHLELIKKIRLDNRSNVLAKFMIDRYFDDCYKSIVVLANPKTVLNNKYAKKEVKDKVIRADQLVKYIKDTYERSKEAACSEQRLLEWAQSFLDMSKEAKKDYLDKYDTFKINANNIINLQENVPISEATKVIREETEIFIEESDLFKELKAYRLRKSREENIKPYFIYNDNQLKDLIIKMPGSKLEMQTVAGFGEAKVNKYGDDILSIMVKFK